MTEATMALTKSFKELVQRRVASDAAFAESLLREGIDTMLAGDVDTGKAILRDYIKATVGFEKLGEATDTPAKSLIRMFGPRGNPQARNLFGIIGYLQKQAGIELHASRRQHNKRLASSSDVPQPGRGVEANFERLRSEKFVDTRIQNGQNVPERSPFNPAPPPASERSWQGKDAHARSTSPGISLVVSVRTSAVLRIPSPQLRR